MRDAVGTSASDLEPRQSNRYGAGSARTRLRSLDVSDLSTSYWRHRMRKLNCEPIG
jgi:hypothetical protein